ncbi:helix-turn-helix transcriptional regulator [Litorimonas sp.]|jgi:putative transcriptional regulator|uniref:helix-turn-helix transcriptional regulator n=1 Tax=Litorimonas sp. TaxID=1892381 RepID=UPI003A8690D1
MGGKKSKITNRIKRARVIKGLSQVELAERVGATRQTIIAVEAERYAPSLELAFRLAHILEEPIDGLFIFDPSALE